MVICLLYAHILVMFFIKSRISEKKIKEKSRKCHNHKPQPFPDIPTNLNKHKPNKRTKSTKISSLFPKRGNRNTKRTEKHRNKMTHGKTYNKSPRRINHKATKSKTNTGTTALERSLAFFKYQEKKRWESFNDKINQQHLQLSLGEQRRTARGEPPQNVHGV